MLGDGGGDFRTGQRIKLVKKEDSRARVFAAAAFGAQFMADFAAGDKDARGAAYFTIGNERQEAGGRELVDDRTGVGMPQHAFGCENDIGRASCRERVWS